MSDFRGSPAKTISPGGVTPSNGAVLQLMLCLGLAILLVLVASQGRACVSLNHDWRIPYHESRKEGFPGLGISEFLAEAYRRFQEQRRVLGQATGSPTITIGGGNIVGNPLSTDGVAADVRAVLPGWWGILPASQCVSLGGEEVGLATMGLASGAFFALLDVASSSSELSFQVDLNHPGMIFRLVYLEKLLGRLIVLDHQGEIAFIEEISVHPLLQTDLIFCPFGAFIRNFEKKSVRPFSIDWEKLFPQVVAGQGSSTFASPSIPALPSGTAPVAAPDPAANSGVVADLAPVAATDTSLFPASDTAFQAVSETASGTTPASASVAAP